MKSVQEIKERGSSMGTKIARRLALWAWSALTAPGSKESQERTSWNDIPRKLHRIVPAACVCVLLSACAHLVSISYPPEAVIHPTFNQRFTTWEGERVQVALAPSMRGEALTYLGKNDQVLLANLVRQRGLHHEYGVAGKGTPLVVYSNNPVVTPREKHYPGSGIALGVTAVKEDRPGQVPLLKMYDTLDPSVVRCAHSMGGILAHTH